MSHICLIHLQIRITCTQVYNTMVSIWEKKREPLLVLFKSKLKQAGFSTSFGWTVSICEV